MFHHAINKLGLGVKTVSDQVTDFPQQSLGIAFDVIKVNIYPGDSGFFRRFIGFGFFVGALSNLIFDIDGRLFGYFRYLGCFG